MFCKQVAIASVFLSIAGCASLDGRRSNRPLGAATPEAVINRLSNSISRADADDVDACFARQTPAQRAAADYTLAIVDMGSVGLQLKNAIAVKFGDSAVEQLTEPLVLPRSDNALKIIGHSIQPGAIDVHDDTASNYLTDQMIRLVRINGVWLLDGSPLVPVGQSADQTQKINQESTKLIEWKKACLGEIAPSKDLNDFIGRCEKKRVEIVDGGKK